MKAVEKRRTIAGVMQECVVIDNDGQYTETGTFDLLQDVSNITREELLRRVTEEDTPALRAARAISLGELVRRYGDPASERAFDDGDYKQYLLNTFLEQNA